MRRVGRGVCPLPHRPIPSPDHARSRDARDCPPADSPVVPPAPDRRDDGRGAGTRRGAGAGPPRRPDQGTSDSQRRQPEGEGGPALSFRLARAERRLLEPRQPHQPDGPGLRLRPQGRPGGGHGEKQPLPRPREDPGALRVPAREYRQSRRRVRRPERPLPGPARRRRAGDPAPVHRLVRRPRLADHAGRRDRQVREDLHRGEGLGPDLPGLHRRRHGAVRLRRHQPDARQEHARRRRPDRGDPAATAWGAATTSGSPGPTPGPLGPSGSRPRAISRGSRPTTPTRRA